MNLALRRVLAVLLGLAVGAIVGAVIGGILGNSGLGALLLGAFGAALVTWRDSRRAHRLLEWLRGPQGSNTPGPRDRGYWGEVAYRIERALRLQERTVEQERERLRLFLQAIEASPNGVLLLDADDRIEWCTGRAADHFGLDPARDRAQKITNLIRAPAFVAHLQGADFDEPLELTSSRGRASLQVLVRRYGEGQKLVLTQDVTERDRTDAMRRDFVANVSHEIRTPLTVLSGFVETLGSVPLSAAEQPRVLELMRQQTARIGTLVDDLLTLAQIEGSPRPPSDRWVPVEALLKRALADAELLSAGRHQIVLEAAPDGAALAGVDSELHSALDNLLGNAVRYTPEGGRIVLRWRVRAGDGRGEFEVRDNGIGIAREHIPRLTERFYRVDGSRSRDTGGTGLGLAIVKHVVQRHGGELEVESEPGVGSAFRILLPAARVRVAQAPALRLVG